MTQVRAQHLDADRLWLDKAVSGLCSIYVFFDTTFSIQRVLICASHPHLAIACPVGTTSAYITGLTASCILETCTADV
jgi:hypothetical protein